MYSEAVGFLNTIYDKRYFLNLMSLVSKYADKHARKYSPNIRNNSDDRVPK